MLNAEYILVQTTLHNNILYHISYIFWLNIFLCRPPCTTVSPTLCVALCRTPTRSLATWSPRSSCTNSPATVCLRASGVYTLVLPGIPSCPHTRIAMRGFPNKMLYPEFKYRYACLGVAELGELLWIYLRSYLLFVFLPQLPLRTTRRQYTL